MIIEVNRNNFEEEVIKNDKKVLVDFNAGWCGPCRMLKPVIEELASEMKDVTFVSIDIDNEEELASKYDVSSIPCLVLFKDGLEVNRSVGLIPKEQIIKFLGE